MNASQTENESPTIPVISRRKVLIGASVAFVVAAVLYQTRPDMISPLGAALALMTCAIGILPTFLYVLRNERTVPFFPAVGMFQVFCFGLSPFLLPLAWPDAPPIVYWGGALTLTGESIKTLALVLAGTAALVASFLLLRRTALGWLPALRIRERCS